MSDNTLDDLILTDPEPDNKKSKGILALLALVVLLIIVGAILAKMIFSSPEDANAKDSNSTTEIKKDIITNNANASLDNNTKGQDNTTAPLDADLTPLDDTAMPSNVETVGVDESSKKDDKKISNNEAMSVEKTDTKVKNNIEEPAVEHKVKKIVHKAKPKVTHKPKTKHVTQKIGGHGSTYIQVGSFSKGPNSDFINKIIKSGFRYRIKEVNGFRRVYVGPFTSSEASSILGRVKAKISQSAFIKK